MGSAVVLTHRRYIGTFLLENLSAGGALLVGDVQLAVGEPLRVLLQLSRSPRRFGLEAVVVRHTVVANKAAFAIRFVRVSEQVEDAIQTAIVYELREGPPLRVVLVVDSLPLTALRVAQDLESLGCEAVTVVTALDAITWLSPSDVCVEATIVNADLDQVDGLSMLEFIAADYPTVRRILLSQDSAKFESALTSGRVHALLSKPWTRETLTHAVRG